MPTTTLTDPTQWATATLTQDELWMARDGTIMVTNEAPLRDDQGTELSHGMVREMKNGWVVRYRPVIPAGVDIKPILVREVR